MYLIICLSVRGNQRNFSNSIIFKLDRRLFYYVLIILYMSTASSSSTGMSSNTLYSPRACRQSLKTLSHVDVLVLVFFFWYLEKPAGFRNEITQICSTKRQTRLPCCKKLLLFTLSHFAKTAVR